MQKSKVFLSVLFSLLCLSRIAGAEIYTAIAGKVIAEDTGKGLGGVDVNALWIIGGTSGQEHTVTDQNGNYALRNLRPGMYVLGFMKKGSPYLIEEPNLKIDLPRGKNVVNANYIFRLGGSVSGLVYAADGVTPLSKIRVSIEVENPQPKEARSLQTTVTDVNGKYFIQGLPASDTCIVAIEIPGRASIKRTMNITKGKAVENINFVARWDDTTGITGIVKSSIDNKPVVAALITLWDSADNEVANTRTDDSGTYSITGVAPGLYKATAFWPGGGGWVNKTSIVIESGKLTTVNIEFDKSVQTSKYDLWEKFAGLFVSVASASTGSINYPDPKTGRLCNLDQKIKLKDAYESVKGATTGCSDMSNVIKSKLQNKLSGEIILQCIATDSMWLQRWWCDGNCGYGFPDDNMISICPSGFNSSGCGCLQSVELHEFVHTVGYWGETVPLECEKACFSGCCVIGKKWEPFIKGCGCK